MSLNRRLRLSAIVLLVCVSPALADPPEPRAKLEHDGPITCLSFSPDSKLLAAGDKDSAVRLWNTASAKLEHKLASAAGDCLFVAFAPDGRSLATSATDGAIRIWDPRTGRELSRRETTFAINRIAFVDDQQIAVIHRDEHLVLYDCATMKEQKEFVVPTPVRWLGLLRGGRDLATLTVKQHRINDSVAHEATVHSLEVQTGRERRPLMVQAERLVLSPDGKTLLGWWDGGKPVLREMTTGQERGSIAYLATAAAFSPDGRYLATADPKEPLIRIWDLVANKELVHLEEHETPVTALAFSPDGRTLASGGGDFTVYLWDMAFLSRKKAPPIDLTPDELKACWEELASTDGVKAFQARNRLVLAAKKSVPFLKDRLAVSQLGSGKALRQLLEDLDNRQFDARQRAGEGLLQLGEQAEPALVKILNDKPPLEVRRRVEAILERIKRSDPSIEQIRMLRAIEALELCDTPASRQALADFAVQTPQTLVSEEAQAARRRLARRTGK